MPRPMLLALILAAALAVAGCGREDDRSDAGDRPALAVEGDEADAAENLGFPTFASKNTTRVGGADATATAAAVARAVYPDPARKPGAVALVDQGDWRGALAAGALMADPVGAPLLLSDGRDLPDSSRDALAALDPTGAETAGNAEIIRVGNVAAPEGRRSTDLAGANPFARARAIAGLLAAARGRTPDRALIVSADAPGFAAPAAAYAAKSGDPILFVTRDRVPPETREALEALRQPRIFVLGPSKLISPKVTRSLRRLGRVKRTGGQDPVTNAIEFARYRDGAFGWGIVDPGHGLVFARADRPLDAAAAAPLSGSGKYGPLLLLDTATQISRPLQQYLLDIQPGFEEDPVRGVYNHGWIMGDDEAISVPVQARLDALLEIVPVQNPDDPPDS